MGIFKKICFHDWQEVEGIEHTGDSFAGYAMRNINEQLAKDFDGLLELPPWMYGLPGKESIVFCTEDDLSYFSDYHQYRIEAHVYMCLKCHKYKTDAMRYKDKIKRIYKEYYKQNMTRFINKSKKIKLTLDGISEIQEGANHLESLNIVMKEFGQIHVREKQLLAKIRNLVKET